MDAYILHAIQDGKSRQFGTPSPGNNIVGPLWNKFFVDLDQKKPDQDLKQDWGHAEQSATDNGRILAEQMHADTGPLGTALAAWATYDFAGDIYRGITGVPHGGGFSGAFLGIVTCGGLPNIPCLLSQGYNGYQAGEFFTDPRSRILGGPTPTGIAGDVIYDEVYHGFYNSTFYNIGLGLDLLYQVWPK